MSRKIDIHKILENVKILDPDTGTKVDAVMVTRSHEVTFCRWGDRLYSSVDLVGRIGGLYNANVYYAVDAILTLKMASSKDVELFRAWLSQQEKDLHRQHEERQLTDLARRLGYRVIPISEEWQAPKGRKP